MTLSSELKYQEQIRKKVHIMNSLKTSDMNELATLGRNVFLPGLTSLRHKLNNSP